MAILHFSERGAITAHYVFDALIVSSNDDPYLKAIARDGRHCHGYGFVAALNDGRGWRVVYERFDAEPSLTGEEACQSNLEALENGVERLKNLTAKVEEALIMLHSRRTMNEPRGIHGAHPFKEETLLKIGESLERAEAYLCHNGGIEKQRLASTLSITSPELYTDSHLYLKYLVAKITGTPYINLPQTVAATISESVAFVRSALDLGILVMTQNMQEGVPTLLAVGYVKDTTRWRYYEPVIMVAEALTGYVSSTVRDVLRARGVGAVFYDGRDRLLWDLRLPKPLEHPITIG